MGVKEGTHYSSVDSIAAAEVATYRGNISTTTTSGAE